MTQSALQAAAMGRALCWDRTWDEQRVVDAAKRCTLGRVALPQFALARKIGHDTSGEVSVVIDGELRNHEELRAIMSGRITVAPTATDAELIADGYRAIGVEFLSLLDGKFAVALWDSAFRTLHLVTDRFGMKPLYYRQKREAFLFASEMKSIAAASPLEFDASGVALFLSFGQMLGDGTLFADVRIVPAATVQTFQADDNSLRSIRYWRPEPAAPLNDAEALDRLVTAFERSVNQCVRETPNLGISLSGGLDGRTILAAVDHRATPMKSLCLGMEGSLDHRTAAEISRLTNRNHHVLLLDSDFLINYPRYLRRMIQLTDGQYLDQGIVVPTLAKYRELNVDTLLRGHAGELLHLDKAYNFSVDADFLNLSDSASPAAWCASRLSAFMLSRVDRPLLRGIKTAEMQRIAAQALDDCIGDSEYLESKFNRLSHLFLGQRTRRETALSMTIFSSVVETRLPYLDRDVVEAILAIPGAMRLGDRLQSEIIHRRNPALLRVANSNNGARLGAPRWLQRAATFRMKVLGRLGVQGYQPYERLGLWLRRELQPFVREVILSERCLDNGLFVPETMRWIVEEHVAGRRNFTYLIQALMILELGRRMRADGDFASEPSLGAPVAGDRC
jgi:asparagine synthase (glutamine-hydrolysing)